MSDELRQEGLARELVNRIQNLRKANGYEITDKITVQVEHCPEMDDAVANFSDYIASQVLATSLTLADHLNHPTELDFEEFVVKIDLQKV